ncbi:thiamine-phosphate kinase [Microbacterium hydrocarbonoxydans]|uniref:thiamine-phosphate kinase n=1 Tax=Microbacterium hydrocarbonoxydans TaxID=273678 RepID=UPI003D9A00C1
MPDEHSSEPERVREITTEIFGGQSGSTWRQPTAEVTLVGGADRADDAAWLHFEGSAEIVMASDYVRGSEFLLFQLGVLDHYDIGYYLAAANISDIAAMGAEPLALTSVVRYPKDLADKDFSAIMRGIRDCCRRHGCHNIGGDIGTAERIILSASALGMTAPGTVLARDGARVGDLVVLSGATGIALAAMIYFEGRSTHGWRLAEEQERRLENAWKRVEPEVALGRVLSTRGLATSCQDTSDGLRATVEQIERASGVGIEIDPEAVPVDETVAAVAELAGIPALDIVFGGSVDFRLLFTVSGGARDDIPDSATVIGSVTPAGSHVGRLPGRAWEHQSDPLAGYRRHGP